MDRALQRRGARLHVAARQGQIGDFDGHVGTSDGIVLGGELVENGLQTVFDAVLAQLLGVSAKQVGIVWKRLGGAFEHGERTIAFAGFVVECSEPDGASRQRFVHATVERGLEQEVEQREQLLLRARALEDGD